MIHCLDTDPRQYTDPNYLTNYGSFSIVSRSLNEGLKEIGYYSDPDSADFVGISDGLNLGFRYKNKKPFIIHVYDTINSLPLELLNLAKQTNIKIIGLSSQVSNLWRKYGFDVEHIDIGTDTKYYHQVAPKNEVFTFVSDSFANVRAGVEMAIEAFDLAFRGNSQVQLIVKNTSNSARFVEKVNEYIKRGSNIKLINERLSFAAMRALYSQSHVLLQVMRHSSWGLGIHQAAACNCLPIVGNFDPSNTMAVDVLLNPAKEVEINKNIDYLTKEWGLHNTYPPFHYNEEPRFYDYSIQQYANIIVDVYANWKDKYSKIDTRKPIVEKWTNRNAAEQLVRILNK